MPGWPVLSPDMIPAENMWPALKKAVKLMEKKSDKFTDFKRNVLRAVRMYQASEELV